jgi:hypothetical protein
MPRVLVDTATAPILLIEQGAAGRSCSVLRYAAGAKIRNRTCLPRIGLLHSD